MALNEAGSESEQSAPEVEGHVEQVRCAPPQPPRSADLISCSTQEENRPSVSEEVGGSLDAIPASLPSMPSATVITPPPEGEVALCTFQCSHDHPPPT